LFVIIRERHALATREISGSRAKDDIGGGDDRHHDDDRKG
jgi:hypothetical protein